MDAVAITIAAGVVVALLSHVVTKIGIDPALSTAQAIGDVDSALTYWADVYANPNVADAEVRLSASRELRGQAAKLRARTHAVSCYRVARCLRLLPPRDAVVEASREMIRLSNSLGISDSGVANSNLADEIREKLRLPKLT